MIKILIIAISLSYGAVDHSRLSYEPMEQVMTIPQDMYCGRYIIEFSTREISPVLFGDAEAWQPKEVRLSQKGDNNTKTKA